MSLLPGLSSQHLTLHQPLWTHRQSHFSHVHHTSHTDHTGLVGTFSRVSRSLRSVPAPSNLHFLNWNSHNKQRSLQLSGLLFLRRQWGQGGLNNIFFLSCMYLYIQREKSEKNGITHCSSQEVGSWRTFTFSLCFILSEYFMKSVFYYFSISRFLKYTSNLKAYSHFSKFMQYIQSNRLP